MMFVEHDIPKVHTFYEATGVVIADAMNKTQQEKLIAALMDMPNSAVSCAFPVSFSGV